MYDMKNSNEKILEKRRRLLENRKYTVDVPFVLVLAEKAGQKERP